MNTSSRQKHNIPPIYNKDSRILILGSFPSVKSREGRFFYNHPQNRFWKVISALLNESLPSTIEEKRNMLLSNHIALWDVIESCEISGSSDTSIRNAIPNNLKIITDKANIRHIYINGGTAFKLFKKYNSDILIPSTLMPSTSPANAAASLDVLISRWHIILNEL